MITKQEMLEFIAANGCTGVKNPEKKISCDGTYGLNFEEKYNPNQKTYTRNPCPFAVYKSNIWQCTLSLSQMEYSGDKPKQAAKEALEEIKKLKYLENLK